MWDGSEFAQLEEADDKGSDHEGSDGEEEMHPAVNDNRNREAFENIDEYIAHIEDRLAGVANGNKELRTEVNASRKKRKAGKSNNTPKSAH